MANDGSMPVSALGTADQCYTTKDVAARDKSRWLSGSGEMHKLNK